MAERPVFIPLENGTELVKEVYFPIPWHGGFALVQKKKNIAALHSAAITAGYTHLLEVSTKSDKRLGQHLSAFHLKVHSDAYGEIPLECAFQGSKIFAQGGPFKDLYRVDVRTAKRDPRLHGSGQLVAFKFDDTSFPPEPKSAFYDWLYLRAIYPHRDWLARLYEYAGFTDIEFNPHRSINCQARSCALFVGLAKRGLLDDAIQSPDAFVSLLVAHQYNPSLRAGTNASNLGTKAPTKRSPRKAASEYLWQMAEASDTDGSLNAAIAISDLVTQEDFPYSCRNKVVRIKDIVGLVIDVSSNGEVFKLRDCVSGQVRTFHTQFLRDKFGPGTAHTKPI